MQSISNADLAEVVDEAVLRQELKKGAHTALRVAKAWLKRIVPLISDADALKLLVEVRALRLAEFEELAAGTSALVRVTDKMSDAALTCPSCGGGPEHWRYVQDAQSYRPFLRIADDTLLFESCDNIYPESGSAEYFDCYNVVKGFLCLAQWPIPPTIKFDFE